MRFFRSFFSFVFALLLTGSFALAALPNELSISGDPISFVPASGVVQGQEIRVYATVRNFGKSDLLGTVKFFVDGQQINVDQPVSVKQGSIPDEVFIIWIAVPGRHAITAELYPYAKGGDDPGNNVTENTIFVDWDTDGDGVGDLVDVDDDNDGVTDVEEKKLGTDSKKSDTDGDGCIDSVDQFPLDATECTDTDGDGIGDNADPDADGDGLSNEVEKQIGTDPLNPDTDGDGCIDSADQFPLDPSECVDTDGDGIGDNADLFPQDPNEWADCDGDGIGDNADKDDDNDGVLDTEDQLPCNAGETKDTDGDGIGDNADKDDDNDGVLDINDAFPLDPTEWKDSDHDGLGDNADPNDHNQGPVPSLGGDRLVTVNIETIFDASASEDVDGEVRSFVWDFGDGTAPVENSLAPHIFTKLGIYTVQLTVTDNAGESRVGKITVTVENPPYLEETLFWLLLFLLLLFAYVFYRTVKERQRRHPLFEKIRKPKQ